jgi:hypothetical protein
VNNIEKLLTALLAPLQDVENCLQQLATERDVDSAIGAQLDVVGNIVGQDRLGYDDDLYRRFVRARVSANRSKGRISDIYRVIDLLVYDDDATYVLNNTGIASFELSIQGVTLDAAVGIAMMQVMRDVPSAGVRMVVDFSTVAPASTFTLGDSTNGSIGSNLNDSTTPSSGVSLPWALE